MKKKNVGTRTHILVDSAVQFFFVCEFILVVKNFALMAEEEQHIFIANFETLQNWTQIYERTSFMYDPGVKYDYSIRSKTALRFSFYMTQRYLYGLKKCHKKNLCQLKITSTLKREAELTILQIVVIDIWLPMYSYRKILSFDATMTIQKLLIKNTNYFKPPVELCL